MPADAFAARGLAQRRLEDVRFRGLARSTLLQSRIRKLIGP